MREKPIYWELSNRGIIGDYPNILGIRKNPIGESRS